ncbi:MAG: DUF4129 domain-containing protein [Candidatus Hydrogenedens sp.]|nr:DUF4129 domain-containing protein [Candidatus Hydrogenedens sp.]
MAARDKAAASSAVQLAEEVYALLRGEAGWNLVWYYIGALPFVLAMMLFAVDIARHPYADLHIAPGALGLALLYCWMRGWQSLFSERMLAAVSGEPAAPLSVRRFVRMAVRQAFVHALGMLMLPISLFFLIPFGFVYASLQQFTVLENGTAPSLRPALREARQLSFYAAGQNHLLIWLLSPYLFLLNAILYLAGFAALEAAAPDFTEPMLMGAATVWGIVLSLASPVGLVVALNIGMLMFLVPALLQVLFGIDTPFTDGTLSFGMPVYVLCVGATYLVLDPAIKTAYVLRVFYGRARSTGADLRTRFERIVSGALAAALLLTLFAPAPAYAQDAAVAPASLNQALDEELEDSAYVWRNPREQAMEASESALVTAMRSVADALRKALDWCFEKISDAWQAIEDFFDSLRPEKKAGADEEREGWMVSTSRWVRGLLVLFTVALLVVLGVLVYRTALKSRKPDAEAEVFAAPPPEVDLHDETTTADALPEDEWLKMARELQLRGETRLAVRALFLGMLAALAQRDLIRVARGKSDLEYQREVARYAHEKPELLRAFSEGMASYEAVWYGTHETTDALYQHMIAHQRQVAGRG